MSGADEIADFYVHTASVRKYLGRLGSGVNTYATAVDQPCFASITRRLVRSSDGSQVVSESRITAPPGAYDLFTSGSEVTVNGRKSYVITTKLATSGPLDLPDHCSVALT